VNHLDPRPALGQSIAGLGRAVGAAALDDEDLEVVEAGPEEVVGRLDRRLDRLRLVPDRDDRRNRRPAPDPPFARPLAL